MKATAKKEDFDIVRMKQAIKQTQPDEICILSGGYANYYHTPVTVWEWLEEQLDIPVYINDYQDLVCDPHGIDNLN